MPCRLAERSSGAAGEAGIWLIAFRLSLARRATLSRLGRRVLPTVHQFGERAALNRPPSLCPRSSGSRNTAAMARDFACMYTSPPGAGRDVRTTFTRVSTNANCACWTRRTLRSRSQSSLVLRSCAARFRRESHFLSRSSERGFKRVADEVRACPDPSLPAASSTLEFRSARRRTFASSMTAPEFKGMTGWFRSPGNGHFSAVRHTSDKRANPSDGIHAAKSKTCTNHRHHGVGQSFMFHYRDCRGGFMDCRSSVPHQISGARM